MKFTNFKAIFSSLALSSGLILSGHAIAQDKEVLKSTNISQEESQILVAKDSYVKSAISVYTKVLDVQAKDYSEDSFLDLKNRIDILNAVKEQSSSNFNELQELQLAYGISKNLQKASKTMDITNSLAYEVVTQSFNKLCPDCMSKDELKEEIDKRLFEQSLKAKVEYTLSMEKESLKDRILQIRKDSSNVNSQNVVKMQ